MMEMLQGVAPSKYVQIIRVMFLYNEGVQVEVNDSVYMSQSSKLSFFLFNDVLCII